MFNIKYLDPIFFNKKCSYLRLFFKKKNPRTKFYFFGINCYFKNIIGVVSTFTNTFFPSVCSSSLTHTHTQSVFVLTALRALLLCFQLQPWQQRSHPLVLTETDTEEEVIEMRSKCRVWWPKNISLSDTSSSISFLFGWFVSPSSSDSLDVVVAFSCKEGSISNFQSDRIEVSNKLLI